jgi:hypothetical protein
MTAIQTPQAPTRETIALDELAGSFRGELLLPTSSGYDTARRIWNGAIDRHPACVARCTGVADVVAAVRFARERDLEIAARGGGHNVAGTAVCDDGVVIDLSAMRAVWVDPVGRTAWVQGGALWGDVDRETQAHGLATTGGIVGHTGVAGLTLGGPALAAGHRRRLLLRRRRRRRRACCAGPPPLRDAARGPHLTHAYVAFQGAMDDTGLHGWHYYWKATNLAGLSDDAIAVIAYQAYAASSPRSYAAMFHMGGAVARVPHDATAYAARDVAHNIVIDAVWLPDESDEHAAAETAWARRFLQALQPHRAGGVYVNFLDSDDDSSRVREAYGDQTYRRLAEVKAKYDPDNAFHHNKNIQPS